MAEDELVIGNSSGDISVFSPIKAKQEEVYTLKFNFNNDIKRADFGSGQQRQNLIETANLIRDNDDLLNAADDEKLMTNIKMMQFYHDESARFTQDAQRLYGIDRKNFDNIVTYAKRIGETNRELEIVAVTDAVQRDKKLAETTAYVTWCVANQDITLH